MADVLYQNARVYRDHAFAPADVLVCGNAVCAQPDPAAAMAQISAAANEARLGALALAGEERLR